MSADLLPAGKKPMALPLKSLNHVSRNCRDLYASMDFYERVLGFAPIKRPGSFDFNGAWLFNYGIGIHLLQAEDKEIDAHPPKSEINPRDDHISFQCEDISLVEAMLSEHGIKWTSRVIEEGGIEVEQLFFHDPDGFMIEICTCEKLPVQPLPNGAITSLASCANPRMKCIANDPQRDDFSRSSLHMLQA
jgi:catechol 2,3-dioxygenase-like lactoylglutathione lyase family enzyme